VRVAQPQYRRQSDALLANRWRQLPGELGAKVGIVEALRQPHGACLRTSAHVDLELQPPRFDPQARHVGRAKLDMEVAEGGHPDQAD
jgi:hypothetical protein